VRRPYPFRFLRLSPRDGAGLIWIWRVFRSCFVRRPYPFRFLRLSPRDGAGLIWIWRVFRSCFVRRPYPFRFLRLSPNSLTVCFSSYGCLNPTVCALRTAYTVHSNPFLQCYSLPSTLTLPSLHCVQPTLCVSILLCNATAYHQYLHCLLCNAYSLNCVFQSCHQVVQALTSLDKEIMRNSNQFQLKLSNIGSSSVLVAKSSVEDLLHELFPSQVWGKMKLLQIVRHPPTLSSVHQGRLQGTKKITTSKITRKDAHASQSSFLWHNPERLCNLA